MIVVILVALAGVVIWMTTADRAGLGIGSAATEPTDLVPWLGDYKTATAESQRTGKPLFIDFSAPWCGPCQSLHSLLWNDPQVAAALSHYVTLRLDVDDAPNQDLLLNFGDSQGAIPALVVVDPGGQSRITIGVPPDHVKEHFLAWLKGQG